MTAEGALSLEVSRIELLAKKSMDESDKLLAYGGLRLAAGM
jgi:hypothetical protein